MSVIEPIRQENKYSNFRKRYPFSVRLWHWINFLVISGSLLTVLINSTLFEGTEAGGFIKGQLEQVGVLVTPKQARAVSHGLEDRVWGFHIYFGYILAGLLIFRVVTEMILNKSYRLTNQLGRAYKDYQGSIKERRSLRHALVVKSLYVIFYIILIIMAVTGLSVAFDHNLGISKSMSHSIKEIHGFCMYLILAFIIVHLAGVILAERKDSKGIVSDMINGGDQQT